MITCEDPFQMLQLWAREMWHYAVSANGSALCDLIFLCRREKVAGKDSFSFIPVQNVRDDPEPRKMLSQLHEANLSVSTALGPAGRKNRATWGCSVDTLPSAQLDIEGSQSFKKSSWHFPGR